VYQQTGQQKVVTPKLVANKADRRNRPPFFQLIKCILPRIDVNRSDIGLYVLFASVSGLKCGYIDNLLSREIEFVITANGYSRKKIVKWCVFIIRTQYRNIQ